MMFEGKNEYIRYRIETAKTTFDAAKVLADNNYWNSVVNRLYYSVFYAVNALLVHHDIQTKSHSATKSQFSQHFIKTGKFDKKYGRLFSELFDWRQKGDYENIFDYEADAVRPLFDPVWEMILFIEKEINKSPVP
jgi:uncharacterized protein (UPF0332 family)